MSWIEEEYRQYAEMMEEAHAHIAAAFDADIMRGVWLQTPEPVSNTFRSCPEPRAGYIDARRDDGCVAVITDLV